MVLFLPDLPAGQYPVGSTTFTSPVSPSVTFGSATLDNGDSALVLDEIGYTAYYPANTTSRPKKGVDWLSRPLRESLKGFAIFGEKVPRWVLWPVVYFYGALVKVPVYPNVPLLHPKDRPWPLVIFSHGLGGSRTSYSQICSRLAASGNVVLAVEHRDGTSPCCITRQWCSDGTRKPRVIHYLQEQSLKRPTPAEDGTLPLRVDQLAFRTHEVYSVYNTFVSMLQRQEGLQLATLDDADIDWSSWTAVDNQHRIQYSKDVALAGHSFGGCTVFHILSSPPPSWASPIPITRTLIHDPWLDPIPSPGPTPLDLFKVPLANKSSPSSQETLAVSNNTDHENSLPDLLVINSEGFTLWDEHFNRLKTVTEAWGPKATLMTLVQSRHPHFSDFFVLPLLPGRKIGLKMMQLIARVSSAFLDGDLSEQLKQESVREMEVQLDGKKKNTYGEPKRNLKGVAGDVIIH